MKVVVMRSSYSTIWRESGDLSCAILSHDGEMIAQAPATCRRTWRPCPFSAIAKNPTAHPGTGRCAVPQRPTVGQQSPSRLHDGQARCSSMVRLSALPWCAAIGQTSVAWAPEAIPRSPPIPFKKACGFPCSNSTARRTGAVLRRSHPGQCARTTRSPGRHPRRICRLHHGRAQASGTHYQVWNPHGSGLHAGDPGA